MAGPAELLGPAEVVEARVEPGVEPGVAGAAPAPDEAEGTVEAGVVGAAVGEPPEQPAVSSTGAARRSRRRLISPSYLYQPDIQTPRTRSLRSPDEPET